MISWTSEEVEAILQVRAEPLGRFIVHSTPCWCYCIFGEAYSYARGRTRLTNPLKTLLHTFGREYIRRVCLSESESQPFSHHNERSVEYRFALETLARKRPISVLDVGSGTTAWPHLLRNSGYVVTAIDNVRDYWPRGMVNRHWTVLDVDILNPKQLLTQQFDAITCISVIEHIVDHETAMRNMIAVLKPGGTLILTTPYAHQNSHPNVYRHADALYGKDLPYTCRSSSKVELQAWMAGGLTLERRELWRMFTGPVWATGTRCTWEEVEDDRQPHQLGCFAFRKD